MVVDDELEMVARRREGATCVDLALTIADGGVGAVAASTARFVTDE